MKKVQLIGILLISWGFVSPAHASLYNGEILSPGGSDYSIMSVGGSFGNQELSSIGQLQLSVDIQNGTTLEYSNLVYQTVPQQVSFSGEFQQGLGGEKIPITLVLKKK